MNTNNRPGREKEIFEQALDLSSPEARLGYVQGASGGDADLLARVQTLLRAHEATGGFLPDNPGAGATVSHAMAESSEKPGTIIGRYKLLEKIGEGGFGSVYMAQQEVPVRRRVALKVIKLGMDTKEVVTRFEAERQALAMMDHPNIARVLDAGATDTGRPYFVMELVKGVPITAYCDQRQLSTPARLELFILVCQAVQHAHQKGIIHRDLKPSNILVTEQDDRPVPKVIDFGVARATQARLTEKTMFTQFHQMVGTPAYMSPEQTGLANLDIDTRSDIYSLGVLLYELLTGCTPFDSKKLLEAGYEGIMRMIREVEPPKPSTRLSSLSVQELSELGGRRQEEPRRLGRLVQGDLDWIVMKALEKDRTRRYETATSLAQDLQRHLGNEPVVARPASSIYRFRKMVRRNRLAFGAAVVVAGALVTGLVVSTWAYYNEKSAHKFAVEATLSLQKAVADAQTARSSGGDAVRQEATKSAYAIQIMKAVINPAVVGSLPAGDKAQILQLIDATAERLGHNPQIRPATRQELLDNTGDLYLVFGEFARAEAVFRQTLALRRLLLGPNHPETTAVLNKLIESLKRQGKAVEVAEALSKGQALQAKPPSGNWGGTLIAQARDLRIRGKYAEAETRLREAIEFERQRYGGASRSTFLLEEIAWIHLEAGDLSGTKQLALQKLETDQANAGWFSYGILAVFNFTYDSSYNAHTLLGLAALRAGNRAEADRQLLRSANGVVTHGWGDEFKFGARQVQLAAELLAAGESATVVQFLDRIRGPYADDLGARASNFFNLSWEDYYNNSAKGRARGAELDGWRREILDGKIPAAWQQLLEADRALALAAPTPLPSVESLFVNQSGPPSFLFRPVPACALLILGWLSLALAIRYRAPEPLPAGKWLIAYGAVCSVGCAFFAGTFLGDGIRPNGLLIFMLTIAGWRLLWEFIRALAPAAISQWEVLLIRVISWGCIIVPGAIITVAFLSKDHWARVVLGSGSLLTLLITLVLVLSVSVSYGWRVWRWAPSQAFRGARLALLLATPLVALHGLACLSLPFFHEGKPAVAVALLWANALLPWLLAAGFGWRGTSQPAISSPKTPAPSH